MKHISLIILSFAILQGCKVPEPKNKEATTQEYVIKVMPENLSTIPVSMIYDSIKFLPLETNENCLIEKIDKICFTKNSLIILDNGRSQSQVLCFDKLGRFKFKIGNEGKGPGEYYSIANIAVNGNKVYILDVNGKILCYDLTNNKLLNEKNTGLPGQEICILNDSIYFIRCNGGFPLNKKGYYLYRLNRGKVNGEFFPFPKELNSGSEDIDRLFKFNDKVFFNLPYSNVIYEFNNNTFKPHLKIDFNGHYKPYKEIVRSMNEKCSPYEFPIKLFMFIENSNIIDGLSGFTETEKYITGTYHYANSAPMFIYNKMGHKTVNVKNIKTNENIFLGRGEIAFTDDNYYVSYFYKSDFDDYAVKYKERIHDDPQNPINYFSSKMNLEDNPVLIFTHFNPKIR